MSRDFIKSIKYNLTIWDYEFVNDKTISKMKKDDIYFFIAALEKAPDADDMKETKGLHFQAYIELKKQCTTAKQLKNILGLSTMKFNCKPYKGDATNGINYVLKEDTKPEGFNSETDVLRFGNPHEYRKNRYSNIKEQTTERIKTADEITDELAFLYIEDVKNGMSFKDLTIKHIRYFNKKYNQFIKLYDIHKPLKKYPLPATVSISAPWQKELVKQLEDETNDRKIIVNVGKYGNDYKTTTSKIIHNLSVDNGLVSQVLNTGKTADLSLVVKEDVDIVAFDLSRSQEEYINFDAIESIKNGSVFSSKYQSTEKYLNKQPKLYINCNSLPRELYDKISMDRLIINVINKDKTCETFKNLTPEEYIELYDKGMFKLQVNNINSFHDEPDFNVYQFTDEEVKTYYKLNSSLDN